MKIIVGLGNPGEKYKNTRHNAGFIAINKSIADLGLRIEDFRLDNKFKAEILETTSPLPLSSEGEEEKQKYLFVKPQTFMNESGTAVKAVCDFYKVDVKNDLLVIHDDSDLPLGTIRTTESSSSAGHNGVADIIEKLGSQDFHRIRIGVESRASRNDIPTEAFVLQNFSEDEIKKLEGEVLPKVKMEIDKFVNKSQITSIK